ncbi:ABC transporter permease [Microbacterium sp. ZW T5_45]|uniref:ABC transporter permease n=1 Tax=Microbacterium sp. ZW T5_45 TaxID=3378080 RepID=UPI003851DC4F
MTREIEGEPRIGSAFVEMTVAGAKEQWRDRRGLFSALFSFGFFLLLMFALNLAINVQGRADPVVVVTGEQTAVERVLMSLGEHGIEATSGPGADVSVTVTSVSADVVVGVPGSRAPAWLEVQRAVEAAGYSPADITATEPDGFVVVDLLRANLAGVVLLGFLSATFTGTSLALVTARSRGLLRLLGTTPVRRLDYVCAQIPLRFGFAALIAVVTLIVSMVNGYSSGGGILRLSITLLVGLAMCFSFALLLGSRSRKPEIITQAAVMIPILALFATGAVFPRTVLPEWVWSVTDMLPTNWLVQAAGADLAGTATTLPIPALWALMLGATVIATLIAARSFVWDDRER